MNSAESTQWKRREGYGGPESFPESELAQFGLGHSDALAGKELSLHLTDGRVLDYTFADANKVSMSDDTGISVKDTQYTATEAAPGVFFLKHDYPKNDRLTTCIILDLNRNQVAVIDGEIPKEGDGDYRVRKNHVGGCIGAPRIPGEISSPPFPPDLVGKNFVAEYSDDYAWELIYMNQTRVAWQGLKGNPGIGDVEEYHASNFAPGVYAVSWSERAETLAAVFLYNFEDRTITGHMWGYAPDQQKLLHAPLGGRIVHPAKFGLKLSWPDDKESVQQKNKDVVLRQHYEVWNQAKYELIDEIYTEDFACHFIDGLESTGREALREFISGHRESFPDWTEEVMDVVADGDRVVSRYQSTGTHQGAFQGIAPTGKRVCIPEVSIYRLENGKIAEQWGFPDGLGLAHQLTGG
jgi:steroid delta-isomerase-like uncharacterized protein